METSDRGANDHVEALPEHAFEGVEESFLDLDAFDALLSPRTRLLAVNISPMP